MCLYSGICTVNAGIFVQYYFYLLWQTDDNGDDDDMLGDFIWTGIACISSYFIQYSC